RTSVAGGGISVPAAGGAVGVDGGTLATRGGSVLGGAIGTSRAGVVGGVARATVGRVVVVARGGARLLVGAGCGGDGRASVVVGCTGTTGTVVVVVGAVAVVGGGGGRVGAVAGTVVGVAAASTVGRASISHSRAVADPRLPVASARTRILPRREGVSSSLSPSPASTPSTVQDVRTVSPSAEGRVRRTSSTAWSGVTSS